MDTNSSATLSCTGTCILTVSGGGAGITNSGIVINNNSGKVIVSGGSAHITNSGTMTVFGGNAHITNSGNITNNKGGIVNDLHKPEHGNGPLLHYSCISLSPALFASIAD